MKAFFVFDVESVGLHGEGFAVAGGIYLENGAGQREFCFACPVSSAKGGDEDREWVLKNVPVLEETHRLPEQVRSSFWAEWMFAKATHPSIEMAVECGWPVEARFLNQCVDDLKSDRNWKGPYPLHEIASIMSCAGMSPMAKYERKPSELPAHNPLCDARLSARLLAEAISTLSTK